MRKKEPKRRRLLPLLAAALLLAAGLGFLLKPRVTVTPKAPAEVFTQYLAETVAEKPAETATVGERAEAAIIERVEYTVVEQTDTQVTLRITAPDMLTVLTKAEETDASAEDILDILLTGRYPTAATELTVALDGDGKPVESREFVDAMYGGLLTYLERFARETEAAE